MLTTAFKLGRPILWCALVLLPCLRAHGAERTDVLEKYHERLGAIAQSYNRQFSEILRNRRRNPLAERQIKELAALRNKAIAEARLSYQQQLKAGRPQSDSPAAPRVSREQHENEQWAAQQSAAEHGQKAFWTKVGRAEKLDADLEAAQRLAVEDRQTAFWTAVAFSEDQNTELWSVQVQAVEKGQAQFWAEHFQAPPKAFKIIAQSTGPLPQARPTITPLPERNSRLIASAD